uniref:Uncharacterized protein n=1 Tax=Glossina brevipalpis TaxID=37001 RepID=A0A1A9X1W0_9MUSC
MTDITNLVRIVLTSSLDKEVFGETAVSLQIAFMAFFMLILCQYRARCLLKRSIPVSLVASAAVSPRSSLVSNSTPSEPIRRASLNSLIFKYRCLLLHSLATVDVVVFVVTIESFDWQLFSSSVA